MTKRRRTARARTSLARGRRRLRRRVESSRVESRLRRLARRGAQCGDRDDRIFDSSFSNFKFERDEETLGASLDVFSAAPALRELARGGGCEFFDVFTDVRHASDDAAIFDGVGEVFKVVGDGRFELFPCSRRRKRRPAEEEADWRGGSVRGGSAKPVPKPRMEDVGEDGKEARWRLVNARLMRRAGWTLRGDSMIWDRGASKKLFFRVLPCVASTPVAVTWVTCLSCLERTSARRRVRVTSEAIRWVRRRPPPASIRSVRRLGGVQLGHALEGSKLLPRFGDTVR